MNQPDSDASSSRNGWFAASFFGTLLCLALVLQASSLLHFDNVPASVSGTPALAATVPLDVYPLVEADDPPDCCVCPPPCGEPVPYVAIVNAAELPDEIRQGSAWTNPWTDGWFSIEDGMTRLTVPRHEGVVFAPRVRLLGSDLLELVDCPQEGAFWSRKQAFVSPFDPDALAGVWTCEFLHGTDLQVVELEFPQTATFPVNGILRTEWEKSKWSARVFATEFRLRDRSELSPEDSGLGVVLNLREAALPANGAARSEVYALRIEGDSIQGIGRWGGCLRLRRSNEVAASSVTSDDQCSTWYVGTELSVRTRPTSISNSVSVAPSMTCP